MLLIFFFEKSAMRDHFSLKEIANFHQVAPMKKLLTITSIEIFKKSAKRDHFSLKKIAIFHHIAPIKNLLTITSIENFQKIRQARPFFLRGNRDFSSGRPHQKFINHNFVRAQRGKFLNTSLILHDFS